MKLHIKSHIREMLDRMHEEYDLAQAQAAQSTEPLAERTRQLRLAQLPSQGEPNPGWIRVVERLEGFRYIPATRDLVLNARGKLKYDEMERLHQKHQLYVQQEKERAAEKRRAKKALKQLGSGLS